MDDTCAVCADVLEWVAYGACGHRDVCSTCVTRLRFICDDRRCCICKAESASVFVTKALGEYTRMINDFSLLPTEPREGRIGQYWYHEDTSAFFDDLDQYKMIKAMCRLSCSICDGGEEEKLPAGGDGSKRRVSKFKNIEHLKGHIFHKHRMMMCSLCLEGRKVFICEQKLYTRAQLNQHISSGNSEVDGNESERGGFTGHPSCEFCKSPFYSDNELYLHMSTEHYTCHMCQRQHPGQYEYFRNYDDLETHFRRDHYLCEDEACLAKKFVVFQTEAEMKRHNTLEHGGRMSRSKRNAALQIPISFCYRRSTEQSQRHGRRRPSVPDQSDNELNLAIEASLGIPQRDPSLPDPVNSDDSDPLIKPFESLTTGGSDGPRYLHALSQSSLTGHLTESLFPPLPVASGNQSNPVNTNNGALQNSMAARLKKKTTRKSNNTRNSQSHATSSAEASNSVYPELGQSRVQIRGNPVNGRPSSVKNGKKMTHSSSAPNLVQSEASSSSEDVQTANRSLVEKLRHALQYDESKFSSFKEISAQYRQGVVGTEKYLDYVEQYGLTELVPELAKLCPDPHKGNELVEFYHARVKGKNASESASSKDKLATDIINTYRTLQSQMNQRAEVVEVLSRDGYRCGKGKSSVVCDEGDGNAGSRSKKKASKFHRMRLGDGSMAALLDDKILETHTNSNKVDEIPGEVGLPVRGVWRKGGVQRLFL